MLTLTGTSPTVPALGPAADQDFVLAAGYRQDRHLLQPVNDTDASRPKVMEPVKGFPLEQGSEPDISETTTPSDPPNKALSDGTGQFNSSPVKVGHGVAVLEESVALGVPDVITRV